MTDQQDHFTLFDSKTVFKSYSSAFEFYLVQKIDYKRDVFYYNQQQLDIMLHNTRIKNIFKVIHNYKI